MANMVPTDPMTKQDMSAGRSLHITAPNGQLKPSSK